MRKTFVLFLVLVAFVLAGCLPQSQKTPAASATARNRPASTVALTVSTEAAPSPASGCTVITQKPTPGPTAESVFAPVSSSDWVKGPTDAKVTILEYSDFQ